MTTITIDKKDYELESLSDETRANITSMQYCDGEIQRLQMQLALVQTARMAYARVVTEGLGGDTVTSEFASDSIKYN